MFFCDALNFEYRPKVTASSNVAGFWLAVLNGGLNYQVKKTNNNSKNDPKHVLSFFQIEHHLFPRVNHTHYHKIAPVVREFCLEKNIPYTHFPTVKSNVDGLVQHLFDLGKQENANPILQDPAAKSTSRMPLIS
jgi:fatty acid desaturase (delta-4 desaturase)